MARLLYRDLAALIELQTDVRRGDYAADHDHDTRSEILVCRARECPMCVL